MAVQRSYHPVSLSRIFFSTALLLPVVSGAQSPEDIIVRSSQPRLELQQGTVLATGFVIVNNSARDLNLAGTLILPDRWRPVLREGEFTLKGGRQETRLVSFSFPPETNAGSYTVRYRVSDAARPMTASEASVEVVILPMRQIQVRLVESPRFVAAGVAYAAVFQVANPGNVPAKILLNTRNSDNFRCVLDSTAVFLAAKENRTVKVVVRTSSTLREKTVNSVELSAVLGRDSSVTARASAVVDVIPMVTGTDEEYLNYPVRVTGRLAGEDERLGGQLEVNGAGSLSERGDDRFEIFVRTTDIQSQSALGLRDEYRIRYTSNVGEFRLGDWGYSLSPLTELNRYAFGGGGFIRHGGATAGGFYNTSRFYSPAQTQTAGFFKYEVAGGYELAVNHLRKQEDIRDPVSAERQRVEAAVTSVRGEFRTFGAANVDLEYAVSEAAGVRDQAAAARVAGRYSWGSFDGRLVNAGPKYRGYYQDVNYRSISLNTRPYGDLHAELYYRDERRNKNNDTSLFYVPRERFLQAGAGYSNLIALYYRHTSQEDLLPNPQYNRREDAAQVRLGYSLVDVSVYANLDFGSAKDLLQNKSLPFRRYALFAGFSPGSAQNYSASWEYSSENNLYSGEKQDRVSMSLGTSLFISNTTNILASLYWSRTFGTTKQEFGLVEASIRHEFPNRHQISVQARQNSFVPAVRTRELAYLLQYSIPLSIPLKRLSANGDLRGTVIGEGQKGVENVLVNVGRAAAITDTDGHFYFPSLAPGRHYLIVDKASIGLERVTLQTMPLEIIIQGGEERRLTINVANGSSIRARVVFNTFADTDTGEVVREMGPQKGVLIEAHNGVELHRRISDARGNVLFAELKPGRWMVRVVGGEVPLYHALEQDTYELDVAGGEQRTVEFRIMPRKRTIRIIHTEEVPVVQSQEGPREASGPCLITYDARRRGYILQISSWATRGKASERVRVAENVTGRRAWVERAVVPDRGIRYRVKVGLFSSMTEAEVYCRKLQELEMEPAHD